MPEPTTVAAPVEGERRFPVAFLDKAYKFVARAAGWAGYAAGLALILLMLLIVSNVVGRYILGTSIHGSEELAGYIVGFAIFMSLATTFDKQGHVQTTIVLGRLKPRANAILLAVWALIAVVWSVAVLVSVTRRLETLYSTKALSLSGAWEIWVPAAFMVIGSALLVVLVFLWMLVRVADAILGRDAPKPMAFEGEDVLLEELGDKNVKVDRNDTKGGKS